MGIMSPEQRTELVAHCIAMNAWWKRDDFTIENHPDSSASKDLIELAIKAFEKFAPKRFLAEERGAWLDVANKIQAGGEL